MDGKTKKAVRVLKGNRMIGKRKRRQRMEMKSHRWERKLQRRRKDKGSNKEEN